MSNAAKIVLMVLILIVALSVFFVVPAIPRLVRAGKRGKKIRISALEIVLYGVMMLYSFLMIYLIVWAFICSLKTGDGWTFEHLGLKTDWKFSNFVTAFNKISVVSGGVRANVFQCLMNGFIYSGGAAFFQTLCTVIVAYCTARYDCKLSKIIHTTVIVVLVLPIAGNLASQYEVAKLTHTYNNVIGMFVMKFGYSNMYYLIFYAAFKSIPKDYMESALLDGASHIVVFVKIMLPLIMTLVGAVFLLFFIQYWNDYQYPMMFLPSMPTASYALYLFIDPNGGGGDKVVAENSALRITAGFLVFMPIFVIFIVFRNKIMGNLQEGGIKC